jgi:methionyl-tRNA formyltransferase
MFNSKLRILFIGMPDLALVCLQELVANDKHIVGIVPPPKTDPSYRTLIQAAQAYKIPCIEFENNLNEPAFLEKIKKLNPDIGIVASYNTLFPKEFYEIPKMGTINCHPSLLPDYRGANPYFHVINNK